MNDDEDGHRRYWGRRNRRRSRILLEALLVNFHMLAGFSGHGLMHAPGCGRAMAELLLNGRYETIDLTRFGWQRLLDGTPLREEGII